MPKQTTEKTKALLESLRSKQNSLQSAKSEAGDAWTDKQQAELEKVIDDIIDLEEQIEADDKKSEKADEQKVQKEVELPNGSENCVVLKLVKGRRFDPMTGEEKSKPFTQVFNYGEWQLFKERHKTTGYTILEVLNNPFGDAVID